MIDVDDRYDDSRAGEPVIVGKHEGEIVWANKATGCILVRFPAREGVEAFEQYHAPDRVLPAPVKQTEVTECCGELTVWDDEMVGTTCGGIDLRGGWRCSKCPKTYLGLRSVPHETWRLAKGGRSIETGIGRIRVDGADSSELIKRLLRLPELEALERRILPKEVA